MTRAELLALPAVVDATTAGRALGLGRTKTHELIRRGEWPTRVLRLGNAYRIPTAELLALLGITPAMSEPSGHHPEGTATATETAEDSRDAQRTHDAPALRAVNH